MPGLTSSMKSMLWPSSAVGMCVKHFWMRWLPDLSRMHSTTWPRSCSASSTFSLMLLRFCTTVKGMFQAHHISCSLVEVCMANDFALILGRVQTAHQAY